MILRPVLLPIAATPELPPRERVAEQSRCARIALAECARLSGGPASDWNKDANGAPSPNAGWHWSIAHSRDWAAAVISREPVGVDVERIRPRREGLFDQVADEDEWYAIGGRTWDLFFRMWTAKEAVLKANGAGIGWLRHSQVNDVLESGRWRLSFRGRRWEIEHYLFSDHVAAITCDGATAHWTLLEIPPAGSIADPARE
jgi:4'-phosphopantetheinyl transferase